MRALFVFVSLTCAVTSTLCVTARASAEDGETIEDDEKKETFGDRFEDGYLSLSVDIKEMRQGIAQTLHNIPEIAE